MSSKPAKLPEVSARTDNGSAKEDKQQRPARDILTAQDFFMELRSGEGQNEPHGMRGSGLSPFIFAMRVSPPFMRRGRDEPRWSDIRTPGCLPPPRLHPSVPLARDIRIGRFRMGIRHPIPQRNCGRFARPSLNPSGERTDSNLGVQGPVVNRVVCLGLS